MPQQNLLYGGGESRPPTAKHEGKRSVPHSAGHGVPFATSPDVPLEPESKAYVPKKLGKDGAGKIGCQADAAAALRAAMEGKKSYTKQGKSKECATKVRGGEGPGESATLTHRMLLSLGLPAAVQVTSGAFDPDVYARNRQETANNLANMKARNWGSAGVFHLEPTRPPSNQHGHGPAQAAADEEGGEH